MAEGPRVARIASSIGEPARASMPYALADQRARGRTPPLCRSCPDWSVRRPRLAGSLGAATLEPCLRRRWARRVEGSRAVRFSARGEAAFAAAFGG